MTTTAPTPRVIGTRTPKVEGVDKVTGRAQFGADVQLPGLLVGRILPSPHAHARIVRIDTSAAEALPGVLAVVTGDDFPLARPGTQTPFGTATERSYFVGQEVIARDKVVYHGQTVAAVAARTAEAAERALELIDVEYEPLPPVFDAVEAMRPGAPVLLNDLFTKSPDGVSAEPSNVAEQAV
ncbi:MAG: xanthine dehydrogenase family protein molybdopterin-binding subunit, partial [Chloroflexota bacterium]|nr:xanthine dehydrogenase family protein molybdopterin-binding subunit [Chloroflexota bacterium]